MREVLGIIGVIVKGVPHTLASRATLIERESRLWSRELGPANLPVLATLTFLQACKLSKSYV